MPVSEVWQYFTKLSDEQVECKTCWKKYKRSGNTSNFWGHLKDVHGIRQPKTKTNNKTKKKDTDTLTAEPIDVDVDEPSSAGPSGSQAATQQTTSFFSKRQLPESHDTENEPSAKSRRRTEPKQFTLKETTDRATSYSDGRERDARLKDALLFMVSKDLMPLSTTEGCGFRHFCQVAVPLWTPPSRKTLTRLMENKYSSLHSIVCDELAKIDSFCLTADCWTDSHTTKSYLGVTVHYPNGITIESATLGVEFLSERHTAEYLSNRISDFCEKWQIEKTKVKLVVTDNADNIRLAVKSLFGDDRTVPCFDHTLDLIPKKAMGMQAQKNEKGEKIGEQPVIPGIPELMRKVKAIVTFSHQSIIFSDMLRKAQMDRGKTEGTCLRLLQDILTRWNSKFLMLERFSELSEVVGGIITQFPNLEMLTGAEMVTLRCIINLLRPFHLATESMSKETRCTASLAIPVVYLLRQKIDKINVQNDAICSKLQKYLLAEISRRFNPMESTLPLAIATVLDPRFKKHFFMSPAAFAHAAGCIAVMMKEVMSAEAKKAAEEQEKLGEQPRSRDDLWSAHDQVVTKSITDAVSELPRGTLYPLELRQYLNKPISPRTTNPLAAWEEMKMEFPHLYLLARRYLPMLSTSVPAERLFSEAGLIATALRNRLTSDHLSMLLFLASVSIALWNKAKKKDAE